MPPALAAMAAICAALALAACGGSDDDEPQTTTATATGTESVPAEAGRIRDCIVEAGFPDPLVGERPPGDNDAPDAELVFNAGNNQPVFIAYYEDSERAEERRPDLEREAKRLNGEYVLEGSVGVLYVKTPDEARAEIEACAHG